MRGTGGEAQDQLSAVFVDCYPACLRLACALSGDRGLAEDAVQEAFVVLWDRPRELRDPAAARAYVLRSVVNSVRARQRREARGRELIDGIVVRPPTEPDVGLQVDLARALDQLPPRRRECVVLRYVLDLTEAETARALGVRVGTVKSQTHKALAQLRDDLAALRVHEGGVR